MTTFIQQRATGIFDITVRDKDGVLVNLNGSELVFQARLSAEDEIVIEKRSGDGIEHADDQSTTGMGLAVMTFDPDDTDLAAETLRYGLWLVDVEDNEWPLIEGAVLVVRPSIVQTQGES